MASVFSGAVRLGEPIILGQGSSPRSPLPSARRRKRSKHSVVWKFTYAAGEVKPIARTTMPRASSAGTARAKRAKPNEGVGDASPPEPIRRVTVAAGFFSVALVISPQLRYPHGPH